MNNSGEIIDHRSPAWYGATPRRVFVYGHAEI